MPRERLLRWVLSSGWLSVVVWSSHAGDLPLPAGATELKGPYEDRLQQEVPFGRHSYYLAPWRAYMDTWPASQFLNSVGVNFTVQDPKAYDAAAQALAEMGVRSARVEIGWGFVDYDRPDQLAAYYRDRFTQIFAALKKHGIRPLILLNSHHGVPTALQPMPVELIEAAPMGARRLKLKDVSGIKPHYTGMNSLVQYKAGYPLIVGADPATGEVELSAPLPKGLSIGTLHLVTLRYHPFSGAVLEDGTANPMAQETIEGWRNYLKAATSLAVQSLGTVRASDAGFDLEVWNEYTFGSDFLNEARYYDPPRKFKEPTRYTAHGLTSEGPEMVLPITVDYANDPANKLPGVKVISGFSNQRPFDSSSSMWPGQAGFSRHYYTGSTVVNQARLHADHDIGPINALGSTDGKPDGKAWHTVEPGSFFIPDYDFTLPEYHHYAYQTETMTRDLQPFPNLMAGHYRYALRHTHPRTSRQAEVWMTEMNYWRWPFLEKVMKETGVEKSDPRLIALSHHLGAKSVLRILTFYSHKGTGTINLFAAEYDDLHLGVLPTAFYESLKTSNYQLTEDARSKLGPQWAVVKRVVELMQTGKQVHSPRKLDVARLVEHNPVLVFKGDSTPGHPDRYQRDDFSVMPFQLDAGRFAVGYYVITRNMTHAYDTTRAPLDPARYDMPEQVFDMTLANILGTNAKLRAVDPMTGQAVPVETLAFDDRSITVRVKATDYPRFLLIEEAEPGPAILGPTLQTDAEGKTTLRFATNPSLPAKVSWGPLPGREGAGEKSIQPAKGPVDVELPGLQPGMGVKITVEHGQVTLRWPLWDYDTQGLLRPAEGKPGEEHSTSLATDVRLPILSREGRPVSFSMAEVPAIAWRQDADGTRTTELGSGEHILRVRVERIARNLTDTQVLSLLPTISTIDKRSFYVSSLLKVPAWEIGYVLDPIAHPGLVETHPYYVIAPLKQGVMMLSFRGSAQARQAYQPQVVQIVQSLQFSAD